MRFVQPYLACLAAILALSTRPAAQTVLVVDDDKAPGVDYNTIADAVTNAPDGAIILDELNDSQQQFHNFAMGLSASYADALRAEGVSAELDARFSELADRSHAEQRDLEAATGESLDDYIRAYIGD